MPHLSAPTRRALVTLVATAVLVVLATAIAGAGALWELARPDGVGTPTEMALFQNPSPVADDQFGQSVAVEGTLAVVGAPVHFVGTLQASGRAFAYRWSRIGGWALAGELPTGDPGMSNTAGQGLAVSGGHVFVSVPGRSTGGSNLPGLVYVYHATESTITREQTITVTAPITEWGQFGQVIALDGNTMAVSAPVATGEHLLRAGAVFIFEKSPAGTWSLRQRIDADETTQAMTMQAFGYSLALQGDDLIVGSPLWNGSAGRIDIYRRDVSGLWNYFGPMMLGTGNDRFGASVAVDDGLLVATAPGRTTPAGADAGWATAWRRTVEGSEIGWTNVADLYSREPTASEGFGQCAVLSGDTLLISSRYGLGTGNARTGVVYRWLVDRSPAPLGQLVPVGSPYKIYAYTPGPAPREDWFGSGLAFDGDTMLVGAMNYSVGGAPPVPSAGAVWFFGGLRTATVRSDRVLSVRSPGLLGNDTWTPGLTVTASRLSTPSNGVATVNPDGAWTYDPVNSFAGTDTFRYRTATASGTSDSTVTVKVVAPPVMAATSISIKSTSYNTLRSKTFNLTGVLKPGSYRDPCMVWVKKPGKSYWTYSSARLAYSITPRIGANWWYRYDPRTVPRGTYAFRASFAGDADRLPCWSGIIYVKIR
jgi:hypothetical protein